MKHVFRSLCYLILIAVLASATLAFATSPAQSQAGAAWAWGKNLNGQVGDGTTDDKNAPVSASGLKGVTQVSGGYAFSLALKSDGTVWAWGSNSYGQLGDGTNTPAAAPVQTSDLTGVTQIAAGYGHSLALKSDGTVWAWGYNSVGSLGDGTNEDKNAPVQVSGLAGVVQVVAGSIHSLALKADGTVWAWGYNSEGELGDGTNINKNTPIQISALSGIAQVAVGLWHCFAIKSDGTVWAWGYNFYGQHGDGTTKNRNLPAQISNLTGAVQLAATGSHSLALKSDGTIMAWGYNAYGQLGDGTYQNKTSPVQVSGISGVSQLSAGGDQYRGHSLALKSDGTVWAWGAGDYGQLGDGTKENRKTPVQALGLRKTTQIAGGWLHSLAIGTVKVLNTRVVVSNLTLVYGQVILVATLKDSDGKTVANRPLAFTLNGNEVGKANTNATGRANLLVENSLDYTVGSYPFSISSAEDAYYKPSSGSATLTVKKADTVTTVASFTGSPGETKYLTASLTRKTNNTFVANQTLAFKLDGIAIGTATTDGNGVAGIAYTFDDVTAGSRAFAAKFAGDANQGGSSGTGTITMTPTATTIVANSVAGRIGQTVNFVATLTRNTDKAGVYGRTVVFKLAGNQAGTAITDASGVATFAYKIDESIPVGNVILSAEFTQDSLYLASANVKKRSLTIFKANTKLAAHSVAGKPGALVALSAILTRTTDKSTLAGKAVHFQIEGVDIGTATTDANGIANQSYTIPATLAAGKYTITLIFDEDAFYLGYSASKASLVVK